MSEKNVGTVFLKYFEKNLNHVTQIFHDDGVELTCEDLKLISIRIARNILKLGLEKGDFVVAAANPSTHFTPLIIGFALIGVIVVPLENRLISMQLEIFPKSIEPKMVFCANFILTSITEAFGSWKPAVKIVTMEQREDGFLSIFDFLEDSTGMEDNFR
jgi:acyl-CoA synthetase (AMP-forming)/AMP-acid ligase II